MRRVGKGKPLYTFCIENGKEYLLKEWDAKKNGELSPDQVSFGTHRKAWWRCSMGHSWEAEVCSRTRGEGCPFCAERRVVAGENDLAGSYPNLAKQWVADKNLPLTPETVSVYSNKQVWWQCKLGHQWKSTVASRTARGTECPFCVGRKVLPGFNDLRTLNPAVAAQWHESLNGQLTPEQVTVGSSKRVWWQCQDGHVWRARVVARTGPERTGCPVCAGRIKSSKQRYYQAVENDATVGKLLAELDREQNLWRGTTCVDD